MLISAPKPPYVIAASPKAGRLARAVSGLHHNRENQQVNVVEERPLAISPNSQEVVTAMTIGNYPEYLAVRYVPPSLGVRTLDMNDIPTVANFITAKTGMLS